LELPIEQWSKVKFIIVLGSGALGRRLEQYPVEKHKRDKHSKRTRRTGFADDG
jgi:hypothetical protein